MLEIINLLNKTPILFNWWKYYTKLLRSAMMLELAIREYEILPRSIPCMITQAANISTEMDNKMIAFFLLTKLRTLFFYSKYSVSFVSKS